MKNGLDLSAKFYKLILPSTTALHKLRIPGKFVGKYGYELSNVVRLHDPIGGVWCVRLDKMGKTLWFHDGWAKFVEDHYIRYGYFLLFKYRGDSNFNVHIFDLTATEVHYPLNSRYDDSEKSFLGKPVISSEMKEHSDDDFVKILASFPGKPVACPSRNGAPNECKMKATSGRRQDHLSMHDLSFSSAKFSRGVKRGKSDEAKGSISQHRYLTRIKCKIEEGESKKLKNLYVNNVPVAIPRTERNQHSSSNETQPSPGNKSHSGKKTVDAAGKYFPKNPSFTVILKPSNVSPKFSMYVPGAFSKYLPSAPGLIKLLDSDGKTWPVRVIRKPGSKEIYLTRGWIPFAKQNNLQVGDACVFDQIDNSKCMLKISTFRNTSKVLRT